MGTVSEMGRCDCGSSADSSTLQRFDGRVESLGEFSDRSGTGLLRPSFQSRHSSLLNAG